MTATLDRPVTARPPTPDALQVVRRARRAPLRHHRRLLTALVVVLAGAFAARVLLGDFTVTIPDFVRILGGEQPAAAAAQRLAIRTDAGKLPDQLVKRVAGVEVFHCVGAVGA